MRNYSSDHFALQVRLIQRLMQCHARYLRCRRVSPLSLTTASDLIFVVIYGIKIWVVTVAMLKVLEGFHHQAARKITGMTARCVEDREW